MKKYIFAATLLAASFSASTSQAASFNCRYAKLPAEVAICQSNTLNRLDERMASKYFRLRRNLPRAQRRMLKSDQRYWLRQRNRCGYSTGCIEDAYYRRIGELDNY